MSKKLKVLTFGIVFLIVSTACLAVSGGTDKNNNSGKTEQENQASAPTIAVQPKETETPSQTFKAYSGAKPKSGGLITNVTLALGTDSENYDPLGPSIVFGPAATIHAVAAVKKAPDGTKFTAKWFTTDIGEVDKPNKLVDEYEITSGGSGNLDFSLSPDRAFPEGNYRVEIYVNSKLDQLEEFSIVKGGPEGDASTKSTAPEYIQSVTLAKGVKGADKTPVNPTSVFGMKDTIHAVTKFQDAPEGTVFSVKWLVTDIGDVAAPDTVIDTFSITAGGNKNIDFTLVPDKPLPKGTYRVEVLVNDISAWEEPFEVK